MPEFFLDLCALATDYACWSGRKHITSSKAYFPINRPCWSSYIWEARMWLGCPFSFLRPNSPLIAKEQQKVNCGECSGTGVGNCWNDSRAGCMSKCFRWSCNIVIPMCSVTLYIIYMDFALVSYRLESFELKGWWHTTGMVAKRRKQRFELWNGSLREIKK